MDESNSRSSVSETPAATVRTRRRRARLRAQGFQSASYDLPDQIVAGVESAATKQGISASEWLTRLLAGELVRSRELSLQGVTQKAS